MQNIAQAIRWQRPQPRRKNCAVRALKAFYAWARSSFATVGGAAHLVAVACFAIQSVSLDIFLMRYISSAVLVTLFAEVPLFIHLVWYWRQESAARAAPFQWLVYSWVHAAKVVVLFCKVMPLLPITAVSEISMGRFSVSESYLANFYSTTWLANTLLLTPVFYALLMLRTSRAIFGSWFNRITVDLIMHYDMLWHVVIDMVDTVSMFHYARVAEWCGEGILREYPKTLVRMQSAVPFMVFLAIVLHAQSLPGVAVDDWPLLDPADFSDLSEGIETAPRTSEGSSKPRSTWSTLSSMLSRRSREARVAYSPSGSMTATASCGSQMVGVSSSGPLPRSNDAASASEEEASQTVPARPMLASLNELDTPALSHIHPSSEMPKPVDINELSLSGTFSTSAEQEVRRSTQTQHTVYSSESSSRQADSVQSVRVPGIAPRRHTQARSETKSSQLTSSQFASDRAVTDRQNRMSEKKRRGKRLLAILHLVQRHTVVIARKRSAIVSIFFVDMPFLCIRVWMWYLSVQIGRPNFPGLGAKNVVCFILNILQFTLVRVASKEGYAEIQRLTAQYRWICQRGQSSTGTSAVAEPAPSSTGQTSAQDGVASRQSGEGRDRDAGRMLEMVQSASAATSTGVTGADTQALWLSPNHPMSPWSRSVTSSSEKGTPKPKAERERERRGMEKAQRDVMKQTRRATNICAHFWALFIAFGVGILMAQASQLSAIDGFSGHFTRWLDLDEDADRIRR